MSTQETREQIRDRLHHSKIFMSFDKKIGLKYHRPFCKCGHVQGIHNDNGNGRCYADADIINGKIIDKECECITFRLDDWKGLDS